MVSCADERFFFACCLVLDLAARKKAGRDDEHSAYNDRSDKESGF